MVIKNWLSKVKFFWCQGIFFVDFYFKNGGKMNLRIITKNHAADSKIGSPLKIDFKAEWTHESMPTASRCRDLNLKTILTNTDTVFY